MGLGLSSSICHWILYFLTNRFQRVRVGSHLSASISISTGSPQGCVLTPLLYTPYNHDYTPAHSSNTTIKFADDTTVVGLISEGDESAYRAEVEQLTGWYRENNLVLNTTKTKELIVDFRRKKTENIQPLCISGDYVEKVSDFRYLGIQIEEDLPWSANTSVTIKKAQQRLYFLRLLRKNHRSQKLLVSFYCCSIESVLTYCMCVWYVSCTAAERKALQRVINTATKITGCSLPSLDELYCARCLKKTQNIIRDLSHPGHKLFELLPSGRRYRQYSFYSRAIVSLNAIKA
uniref:Reverse transcriptase domain-containing protein n=1 Tax=Sparus aurata TaxID=8175 RepID=A0A671XUC4_SPAAU